MKIIMKIYLLAFSTVMFSQDVSDNDIKVNLALPKFSVKTQESNLNFVSVIDLQSSQQSIFSNNETFNEKILNKQFEKINLKFSEKKIDFSRIMFQCGALEPINSKDLMISAFKYYILNKYILSLFAKTDYN